MSTSDAEKTSSASLLAAEDGHGLNTNLASDVEPYDVENIADQILWPEGYYQGFDFDYEKSSAESKSSSGPLEEQLLQGEDGEAFYAFYSSQQEEEYEENAEEEKDEFFHYVPSSEKREKRKFVSTKVQDSLRDERRRSLFVHSSPTHFPDVNRARKSAFGSIFLRTTAHVAEEAALLKTVADSSYSMLQSLLKSFEKVLASSPSEAERRRMTRAFKTSLQKALEAHGISRTYSDGSVHWDIYPITQNYLFSVQVGEHVHQTRNLSLVEDRILTGPTQKLRMPYPWPSGSVWSGFWDSLGMAGSGVYNMPHGVFYSGKMQDGMFHDSNATLTYPNKFKAVNCVYEKGKLLSCNFQFPDLLMHEKDWKYCKFPDRRFWSEVQSGLKPAKIAQKTQIDPPRRIPTGCYDTSDGFYNPKSLTLTSPFGELLRVPVCEEDIWIKKYCRKGFFEPSDFRPDLYENWFNYDEVLIQSILSQQANFRDGKITYDELQQFYADLDLLPDSSKYKKRRNPSQIAMDEFVKSIPDPKPLKQSKRGTNYQGHQLPDEVIATCKSEQKEPYSTQSSKLISLTKQSKSMLKFTEETEQRMASSQTKLNAKMSKISFKFTSGPPKSTLNEGLRLGPLPSQKRSIPEKYLRHHSILKPPFRTLEDLTRRTSDSERVRKKECLPRESFEAYRASESSTSEDSSIQSNFRRKKNLKNFMEKIVMDSTTEFFKKEKERLRERLKWAQKFPKKECDTRKESDDKCIKILEELFESIPDKEEYCDSEPSKTCDLKKLAEDKYNVLKYWGTRMFALDFDEESEGE